MFGWTPTYLAHVPRAIVFEGVQDVLAVGFDKVRPGFPERMRDVVDKTDLMKEKKILKCDK